MTVGKKYRGKIEAAYHQYIRDRLQGRTTSTSAASS